MRALRAISILAFGLVVTGCGYTLVGRASNLPEDIQRVHVESLRNSTARPQVEQILTNAISAELLTRRRFKVVNSAEEADAILRGTVLSFTVRPIAFDAQGLAQSLEISIAADMKLQRRPGPTGEEGEVVWSNSRYVFREDYLLEEEGVAFFDRENIAIEETSKRFAETLLTDLLEGF